MEETNVTKIKKIILLLITIIMVIGLTGCFGVNGNFRRVRNHVLDNLEGRFDREIEFAVGPSTMAFAALVTSMAVEEEYIDDLVKQISKVQVGVYNIIDLNNRSVNFKLVRELTSIMEERGWKYLVRTVTYDQLSAVFIPVGDYDRLSRIFVIAIDDDQFVMTEVVGNLDRVIEIAIKEQSFDFNFTGKHGFNPHPGKNIKTISFFD